MGLKKDIQELISLRGTQSRTELAHHFQYIKSRRLEAAYKALRQAQLIIDDGKNISPPLTSTSNLLRSRLWNKHVLT